MGKELDRMEKRDRKGERERGWARAEWRDLTHIGAVMVVVFVLVVAGRRRSESVRWKSRSSAPASLANILLSNSIVPDSARFQSRCISLPLAPVLSAASSSLGKRGDGEDGESARVEGIEGGGGKGRKGQDERMVTKRFAADEYVPSSGSCTNNQGKPNDLRNVAIKEGNFCSCRRLNLNTETKDKARVVENRRETETSWRFTLEVLTRKYEEILISVAGSRSFPVCRDSVDKRSSTCLVYVTAFIAITPAFLAWRIYDKIRTAFSWCGRFYRCQYYIGMDLDLRNKLFEFLNWTGVSRYQ